VNYSSLILNLILPVLSIIIPVWVTVYTVNKRIKAQTHENHQPHLVLESIKTIDAIDKLRYYLTFFGRNLFKENKKIIPEEVIEKEKDNMLNIDISLKNIGYGVATNIKFYNLLTGHQVYGSQESSLEENQKLYTTFDIGSGETKKVSSQVVAIFNENELEDHNRILCVYKDLNNIVDSFMMTLNVKPNHHYDYFAYQPSSHSYKAWIRENKKEYKKIIEKYKKL